jgi:hypothetical protein
MSKNTLRALKTVRGARSDKGECFTPRGHGSTVGNHAKRYTAKASRRLGKALSRNVDGS